MTQLGLSGELISEAARHFDRFNKKAADEIFFEYVGLELSGGYRNNGLYLKCFSECDGDDRKTEAKYIRERVKQVKLVFLKAKQEISSTSKRLATKEFEDPYAHLSLDDVS